jgi:PKD repeat protein
MRARLLLFAPLVLAACEDTSSVGGIADHDDAMPVAALVADPVVAFVGESVRLDAGDSVDAAGVAAAFSDSAFTEFRFDFGDDTSFVHDAFWIGHTYDVAGTFTASVTVVEPAGEATAETTVEIRHIPPTVLAIDPGADRKAVIGEWITVEGRDFREANLPDVTFDGISATVEYESEWQLRVQVPTGVPSGPSQVEVDFPDENEGDTQQQVVVARYALATDSWRGRTNIVEFGDYETWTLLSQTLELPDAAVVKVSGDGRLALVGDGRFVANLNPTVLVVDLTTDYAPSVVAELTVGDGPLHGLAFARDEPVAVICDLSGFTLVDLSDPSQPQVIGDREAFDFGELGPTAVALNPDATKLAVLSTFNDRLRFYSLTPAGPVYEQASLDVGPGTQGLANHPDGEHLYVLGGGGVGAIPADFNLGNTTLTVVAWEGLTATNVHGDGSFLPVGDTPVPIDLSIAPSGTAYVSTFDSNFGAIGAAFGDIVGNPTDLGAWQDLIEGFTNLGFGAVVPAAGALGGAITTAEGLFSPFGFQAGVDVRFDEDVYVATALGLGWTLEVLTGDELFQLSLDIDYGVAIGNLVTGDVEVVPLFTAPVVSYIDFNLQYDLGPILELLLPPYALGDVAIQP